MKKLVCTLPKRLSYANPETLIKAVCDVYDKWDTEGKKPGADKYTMDTRFYRPMMVDEVTARWCEITGCDNDLFPFHHDFVAMTWVMFRKETDDSKHYLRKQISEGLL
jgi:hypothetical protein